VGAAVAVRGGLEGPQARVTPRRLTSSKQVEVHPDERATAVAGLPTVPWRGTPCLSSRPKNSYSGSGGLASRAPIEDRELVSLFRRRTCEVPGSTFPASKIELRPRLPAVLAGRPDGRVFATQLAWFLEDAQHPLQIAPLEAPMVASVGALWESA
jgi:hypothetical protein